MFMDYFGRHSTLALDELTKNQKTFIIDNISSHYLLLVLFKGSW